MVKFGLNAGEVYRLVNDVITLSGLYLNFYRTPPSDCAECPMTANFAAIG